MFAKARPQEVAVGIAAEPVDVEDARRFRMWRPKSSQWLEVVADVIAAEGIWRKCAALRRPCRRGLAVISEPWSRRQTPKAQLKDWESAAPRCCAAAEDEGRDRHATLGRRRPGRRKDTG